MGQYPSAWLSALVEEVAAYLEAHSALGGLGWRYQDGEDLLELVVYPTSVQLVGGAEDGTIVMPGFSLDVLALSAVFERVTALSWQAHAWGPDDADGPHCSLEGTYHGHAVWLRVLAEAPADEEPELARDPSPSP